MIDALMKKNDVPSILPAERVFSPKSNKRISHCYFNVFKVSSTFWCILMITISLHFPFLIQEKHRIPNMPIIPSYHKLKHQSSALTVINMIQYKNISTNLPYTEAMLLIS